MYEQEPQSESVPSQRAKPSVLLSIIAVFVVIGVVRPPPQWEYKVVTPPDAELSAALQDAFEHGWQIATARRANVNTDPNNLKMAYEIIFTRPVSFAQFRVSSKL